MTKSVDTPAQNIYDLFTTCKPFRKSGKVLGLYVQVCSSAVGTVLPTSCSCYDHQLQGKRECRKLFANEVSINLYA